MEKKKKKASLNLSLIIGIIAFIVAIFEGGWQSLVVIPMFLITVFTACLGIIPFAGPILYYLLTSWIFDAITSALQLHIPIATNILLFGFLVQAIVTCFFFTALFVYWLLTKNMFKS